MANLVGAPDVFVVSVVMEDNPTKEAVRVFNTRSEAADLYNYLKQYGGKVRNLGMWNAMDGKLNRGRKA
jgi:hypothetical protein